MRRWRPAAIVLALAVLAAFGGVSMYRGGHADAARFARERPRYEALIAQVPAVPGEPRLLQWPWRESGAAIGAQVFQVLVYDESDELAGKPPRLTAAWRARSGGSLAQMARALDQPRDGYSVAVRPMGGHFYLLTETLQ